MNKITLSNGVEMPQMGYGVFQVTPDECGFRVYYPFRAKKLIIQNILIKFIKKGARCGKKCVILHFEKACKIAYRASKCP